MTQVYNIIAGIGILIAIFLFLNNYRATASIINTIGTNAINGISILQGRNVQIRN